jgi:FkbM family methyltransferase
VHRVKGIGHELSVLARFEPRSWPRLIADILAARLIRSVRLPRSDSPRTVTMKDGTRLSYRLNRGDVQAIREIWLDEVYRTPAEAEHLGLVVDLGANIGFTSVYLARRLAGARVVAVEPDPANAALLRRNLAQNGIDALVVEAAIGPRDGTARFRSNRESNLGYVAEDGDLSVPMLSVPTLLERADATTGGFLLKLDIEGGEEQLFTGELGWLGDVELLLPEFHLDVVDLPRIYGLLEAAGLESRVPEGPKGPAAYWTRASRDRAQAA